MDIQQIETDLSNKLSKKRFIHTLGVVESAIYLAKKYGANVEDARLAAMLHDCAKELPLLEMQDLVADLACDVDMLHSGALLCGFDMTIRHLIDSNDTIYPLTIISRNDLIQHMKKGGA